LALAEQHLKLNERCAAAHIVIPAKAGIHFSAASSAERWIPAFAGMTNLVLNIFFATFVSSW